MDTFWHVAGGPLVGVGIAVVFWLMVWGAIAVARVRSGRRSRLGRVDALDATVRPGVSTPYGTTMLVYASIVACGVVLKLLGAVPRWGLMAIVVAGMGVATTVARLRLLMRGASAQE